MPTAEPLSLSLSLLVNVFPRKQQGKTTSHRLFPTRNLRAVAVPCVGRTLLARVACEQEFPVRIDRPRVAGTKTNEGVGIESFPVQGRLITPVYRRRRDI